jgi:6-phosphofructokinase 1
MVVEVMGRDSGWVAAYAGIASGAHVILVPEEPVSIDDVCRTVESRAKAGKKFALVVVAEGARVGKQAQETFGDRLDEFGHPRLGGISAMLAAEISRRTGAEARDVVLGHLVRGGPPSAFDRVYATRLGVATVDLIKEGKSDVMPALRGNRIVTVPVGNALKPRKVEPGLLKLGRQFG